MKAPINSRNGFTLLEILIALAILAISLVSLYVAQGNSLSISATADHITMASFLAEQQMTEWKIEIDQQISENQFPDDKEESGEFDEPYNDFRWERSVRKIEIPFVLPEDAEGTEQAIAKYLKPLMDELSKSVREVKVRVYWGDAEAEKQEDYVLTTHIVKLK